MLISLLLDEITMYYQHSALCIYGLIKNVTNSDMKYSNNTVRFMQYTKKLEWPFLLSHRQNKTAWKIRKKEMAAINLMSCK